MVLLMAQYRKYSDLGYRRSRIPEYCNGVYIYSRVDKNTQNEENGKDNTEMEVRSSALTWKETRSSHDLQNNSQHRRNKITHSIGTIQPKKNEKQKKSSNPKNAADSIIQSVDKRFGVLTGVERGECGDAGEVAGGGARGAAGAEKVVVEGVGGVLLEVGRIVTGAALLDGRAVGAAAVNAARPIDGALQRAVLRVVLGNAPQLAPTTHPHRRGPHPRRGDADEEEEAEGEKGGCQHWVRLSGDLGRTGGGFECYRCGKGEGTASSGGVVHQCHKWEIHYRFRFRPGFSVCFFQECAVICAFFFSFQDSGVLFQFLKL